MITHKVRICLLNTNYIIVTAIQIIEMVQLSAGLQRLFCYRLVQMDITLCVSDIFKNQLFKANIVFRAKRVAPLLPKTRINV